MKLPRIVADQGIPAQIPGKYATAEEFGATADAALAQGAEQFGRAAERTSNIYAHAANVVEQARAKVEVDGALTTFKGQMTDEDIALKQQGNPDQYVQALRDRLKERATQIQDSLASPLAKSAFATHANALAETKLSAAKWDAVHMQNGLNRILEENQQTQDANAAVHGSRTEQELQPDGSYMTQQAAAFKRGLERGPNGLRKGYYTPAEASAMTHKFLASVELGQMYKDAENPEMRPAVLGMLLSGGYNYMDPEKQRTIAHTMQADSDRKYKETQEMVGKWWGEQQQLKVADLYRQAAAGKLSIDQLNADSVDWKLHRTDIAAIQTEMTKPLQEAPSDQATLDRLDISVHSQNPGATEREINADRAAGRLNRKDALAFKDKLVAERNRLDSKADTLDGQRFTQAKALGMAAFNIPPALDKYEGNQAKVWSAYLNELSARAKGGPGNGTENANDVALEIIPRFKAVLGEDAATEVGKIREMLKFQTWPELKAARNSGVITPGEYIAQAGLMVDLDAAMTRHAAVDVEAAKQKAEREKKDAEKKQGIIQRWLPSFGAPPANLPSKDMGRPK